MALVLSTKAGSDERIIIETTDGIIEVGVAPIDKTRRGTSSSVRLSFQAPKHIRIDRQKIYESRKR